MCHAYNRDGPVQFGRGGCKPATGHAVRYKCQLWVILECLFKKN